MSHSADQASPAAVAACFEIPGTPGEIAPLGSGHIHDTFVASFEQAGAIRRYVVQRLNTEVFRDPAAVMQNLERICEHLRSDWQARGASDVARRHLTLVPTRPGHSAHSTDSALSSHCAHVDAAGRWWRVCPFQEGTRSVDTLEGPDQAFEAARAFGFFAAQMEGLPGPPLAETIPHFHDLPHRFADLERALADDPCGRGSGVATEADSARRARDALDRALRGADAGDLPRRTVHNDCKVNNLLFDAATGEGLCVVDLDTVMEGDVRCDFGELLRTGSCLAAEDERELSQIRIEPKLLAALTRGYLAGAGPLLVEAEVRALPLAGPCLALENAVRFLTDHLQGDRYFRIHRPGHNLDRARAQLHLTQRLLEAADAVRSEIEASGVAERDSRRDHT